VVNIVQRLDNGNYEVTAGLVYEWILLRKEVRRLQELLKKTNEPSFLGGGIE